MIERGVRRLVEWGEKERGLRWGVIPWLRWDGMG